MKKNRKLHEANVKRRRMIADKRVEKKISAKALQPRPETLNETNDTGFFVANGIPEADLISEPTPKVPIQRLKKDVRQISASQNEEPAVELPVPINPQSEAPMEEDDGLKVEELMDDMPLDSSMSVKVEFVDEGSNEETAPVEVTPEKEEEVRSNTTSLIEIRPSTMHNNDVLNRLKEENRQLKFANLHLQVKTFCITLTTSFERSPFCSLILSFSCNL